MSTQVLSIILGQFMCTQILNNLCVILSHQFWRVETQLLHGCGFTRFQVSVAESCNWLVTQWWLWKFLTYSKGIIEFILNRKCRKLSLRSSSWGKDGTRQLVWGFRKNIHTSGQEMPINAFDSVKVLSFVNVFSCLH